MYFILLKEKILFVIKKKYFASNLFICLAILIISHKKNIFN